MSYSIGQVSQQTSLSADTLRYYERIGLLGTIARNAGGQRQYTDADVERLRFVQRAQQMDFSLTEIAELLTWRDSPGDIRDEVRGLTEQKLTAIEQRIDELKTLRDELAELVEQCRNSSGCCPIIQRFSEKNCSDDRESN